jgi:hypothetical protein
MGEVLTNGQIGGRRNIIINGAMQISQRSTSASSITSTGFHALDRFQLLYTDAGTWTMSQSSTTPNGFANSLKLDCTSAKSSLASDSRLFLMTRIEGQDVQQFKKGTSDAETYTLSFHVRSNKTGTYQVNIEDNDNIRIVGSTYTISSANTWEKKEITFVADTTGAFANDNGDSLAIMWALVAGTDNSSGAVPTAWEAKSNTDRGAGLNINLADSTDNEWYITGVQLEVGSTATPFEHRSFGEEMQLCQRYFVRYSRNDPDGEFFLLRTYSSSNGTCAHHLPVPMRDSPTLETPTVNSSNFSYSLSALSIGHASTNFQNVEIFATGSFTLNGAAVVQKANNSDVINIDFSAEFT